MKKLVLLFFVALLSFALVACQEDPEPSYSYGYGVSYGLVHGHYVGVAEVVVDENDVIVSVKLDEYYLPYNLAQVVVADPENLPADVLAVAGSRGTNYYCKYFSVAGTLFTGTVNGEAGSQSITYSATGIADIEVWVETEANAKAYVEALEAGQAYIATSTGAKSTYALSNANAKLNITKSASGYWTYSSGTSSYYPLGWGGNMKAIVDALIGTTMGENSEDFTVEEINGKNYWVVGDVTTGATLSDFADYYNLAQQAYDNALAGKE